LFLTQKVERIVDPLGFSEARRAAIFKALDPWLNFFSCAVFAVVVVVVVVVVVMMMMVVTMAMTVAMAVAMTVAMAVAMVVTFD